MRWIKSTGDLFVFGNFLIAISTVTLATQTQFELLSQLVYRPYYIVVFFATFFVYNLHRYLGVMGDPDHPSGRNTWSKKNIVSVKIFIVLSFLILMGSTLFLLREIGWLLIPLCLITLSYSIPIFRKKGKYIRLRDITWMKTFLIALVWTLVTVYLPALREKVDLIARNVSMMALERFLFVFAITIPFDIRDAEDDRRKGVISLAVDLGEQKSKKLAYLLIGLCMLVSIVHYHNFPGKLLAMGLSLLGATVLTAKSDPQRNDYFFLLGLDGLMILQSVVFILLGHLH